MSPPERTQPTEEIADTRARNAGAVVDEAKRALKDREQQLRQLKQYLDDYVRKNTPGPGAVEALRLANHRAFLARLAEAVRAQEQLVEQANQEYERKKEDWRVQHLEAPVLGSGVERVQLHERTEPGLQHQRQTDEDTRNRPKRGE